MALKHAKTSAKMDGGDATLIQPSDWNADHVIDSDGVTIATRNDGPTAPSSGNVVLFGKTIAGGALPAYIGPDGIGAALQPFLGRNKVGYWSPSGNSTSTNGEYSGIAVWNALGTATARNVDTSSFFTSLRRRGQVSTTAANNRAAMYGTAQWFLGGATGMGGFRAVFRFGVSDAATATGATTFVGMSASASETNGADPSASINMIGMGSDAADANMQIMHNDGAGAGTKIDLGSNFPANTLSVDAYELAIFVPPNSSVVGYQVTRLNTGDVASGTITTNLPAANTLLRPYYARNSGSSGGVAVGIDMIGLYIETDF